METLRASLCGTKTHFLNLTNGRDGPLGDEEFLAMTPAGRIMVIAMTLCVSLACLTGAAVVFVTAKRLATETPVMATVAKVWSQRGAKGRDLVYHAQLIFDRKQNDGEVVHCDVPRVNLGIKPATVGATIKVAPRATSCWDPDIICETCVAPTGYHALGFLLVAAVSGLICFFLTRSAVREINS
jgi:hypothetical protein